MCGEPGRRGRSLAAFLVIVLAVPATTPSRGGARAASVEAADAPRVLAATLRPGAVVSSPLGMVVTSSPEASWAGVRMLEAGGNAVDAAVAAAFALTAGDPGGSGLGGQTWMVIRLASGESRAILCPSRVPSRVDRARVDAAREGPDLWGPMAATTPTTVATLAHALRRYGTLTFAETLAPAIEAAEAGYRTQSFEHGYLGDYVRRLYDSDVLYPVYLTGPTGESGLPGPGPLGTCVKLPALADTLRRLAAAGPSDFYSGEIAAKLDAEFAAAGGFVRRTDLMRVPGSVLDVAPVRGTYRDLTALSVPFPAGGTVFVTALQVLNELPPEALETPGLMRGHAIVEAVRLAQAEEVARGPHREVTDGPFVSEWLTKGWAARQAGRIHLGRAMTEAELRGGPAPFAGDRGTSHLSVVDAKGNAVSLTQTLGRYFGAAWAAPSLGFILNAFAEPFGSNDARSRDYPAPGSIPSSPAAPAIFERDGRPVLLVGTAGSSRIASILLNLVVSLVDGRESPADAWARPRIIWEDDSAGPRVMLEVAAPLTPESVKVLKGMGYGEVFALTEPGRDLPVFGGINGIVWSPESSSWLGIVDGRRPAVAAAPSRIASPTR